MISRQRCASMRNAMLHYHRLTSKRGVSRNYHPTGRACETVRSRSASITRVHAVHPARKMGPRGDLPKPANYPLELPSDWPK